MAVRVTTLGYALLGLLRGQARTGYSLRKVFSTTPLGRYSSSPGSIYPALKSLEKQGLIYAQSAGARKTLLAITPAGREVLRTWLTMPVTADELSRGTEDALARFAFLHDYPDPKVTLDFLSSFILSAVACAIGLRKFLEEGDGVHMPLQAQLAIRHGMVTMEASAKWASETYDALKGDKR